MENLDNTSNKSYNLPIAIVSILIPIVVLILFYLTPPQVNLGFDLSLLPALNASLNFTTACLLILGRYFTVNKQIRLHKNSMIAAFVFSSLFLVSYVCYHLMTEPSKYGGEYGYVYYPLLISHIVLAAAIVPLVLFTMARALQERFDKHKLIAKWTWPLWLYVAITGVLVYLMLSPYYGN
jgi:putative membrane protein